MSTGNGSTLLGDRLGGDLAGLHEADLVALHTYLFALNAQIDAALRGNDPAAWAKWDAHIRLLMHTLKRLPAVAGPVFRGATLPADALAGYVPGQVLFEPSFVVASSDPARVFPGNVQYVIHAVQARRVQAVAHTPDEGLVMFFAQTRFKVLAVEPGPGPGQTTVYLAEQPDPRLAPQR